MSEGKNTKAKGRYGEYKLMQLLKKHGYFVMRAPGSGAKVKRFSYVDVVAIKKGLILLFEVKRRQKRDTITFNKEQIDKLKEAEEMTDGNAYVAVYLDDERRWYLFTLDQLELRGNHYLLSTYEFSNSKGLEILSS